MDHRVSCTTVVEGDSCDWNFWTLDHNPPPGFATKGLAAVSEIGSPNNHHHVIPVAGRNRDSIGGGGRGRRGHIVRS